MVESYGTWLLFQRLDDASKDSDIPKNVPFAFAINNRNIQMRPRSSRSQRSRSQRAAPPLAAGNGRLPLPKPPRASPRNGLGLRSGPPLPKPPRAVPRASGDGLWSPAAVKAARAFAAVKADRAFAWEGRAQISHLMTLLLENLRGRGGTLMRTGVSEVLIAATRLLA